MQSLSSHLKKASSDLSCVAPEGNDMFISDEPDPSKLMAPIDDVEEILSELLLRICTFLNSIESIGRLELET